MRVAHLALLALAAGCTDHVAATQIVVKVQSDIKPAEMQRAAIVVERASDGATLFSRCVCVGTGAGCKPFPLSLGLGPGMMGGGGAPFRVRAQGFAIDCGGAPLVEQTAVVSFVPGSSLELDLYLYRACEGVRCDAGKTCAEGAACMNEERKTLPPLSEDMAPP